MLGSLGRCCLAKVRGMAAPNMMMLRFLRTGNLRTFEAKATAQLRSGDHGRGHELPDCVARCPPDGRSRSSDDGRRYAGYRTDGECRQGRRARLGSAGQHVRSPCCVDPATMAATVSWLPGTLPRPAGPSALPCSARRHDLTDEVRQHAERRRGAVEPLTPAVLDRAALVVDAMFGAGLMGCGPAAAA